MQNNHTYSFVTLHGKQLKQALISWSTHKSNQMKACLTCHKQPYLLRTDIKLLDNNKCHVHLSFHHGCTIDTTQPLANQTDNYTLTLLMELWVRTIARETQFQKHLQCCDLTPRCKLRMLAQLSSMHIDSTLLLIAYIQHIENLY